MPLALLLLVSAVHADPERPKLYSATIKEPGFETTIRETKRTANTSELAVRVVTPDAQGGPFSIVAAACEIGKAMKLRYFTMLSSTTEDGVVTLVLYFTADPREPPPKEMSAESRKIFEQVGYLDTHVYRRLFQQESRDGECR